MQPQQFHLTPNTFKAGTHMLCMWDDWLWGLGSSCELGMGFRSSELHLKSVCASPSVLMGLALFRLEYVSAEWKGSLWKWHKNKDVGLCSKWWQVCWPVSYRWLLFEWLVFMESVSADLREWWGSWLWWNTGPIQSSDYTGTGESTSVSPGFFAKLSLVHSSSRTLRHLHQAWMYINTVSLIHQTPPVVHSSLLEFSISDD